MLSLRAGGRVRRDGRLGTESDASRILQGLGISVDLHYEMMSAMDGRDKVKVLLAQALFGSP